MQNLGYSYVGCHQTKALCFGLTQKEKMKLTPVVRSGSALWLKEIHTKI